MVRPVPIPNTAVKRSLADGSGLIDSARVGSRQSFLKPRNDFRGFLFCVGALARCALCPSSGSRAKAATPAAFNLDFAVEVQPEAG